MKSKRLKVGVGIVGALILGAFGSVIGSRVLGPAFDAVGGAIISVYGYFSVSFTNSIYNDAAQGFHEGTSLKVFTLVVFFVMTFCVFLTWYTLLRRIKPTTPDSRVKPIENIDYYMICIFFYAIVAILLFSQIKRTYENRITTWSLNSVERLGGDIPLETQSSLRSQFFRIDDANDFYKFYDKVTELAAENNIELRKFDPL